MDDQETQTWGIAASQPALRADDVEEAREQIEVVVLWGAQALHVAHLEATGRFAVGDEDEGPVDFPLGAEVLGAAQHVVIEDGVLRVPAGATGSLFVDGKEEPLRDLAIAAGVEATIALGELRLVVRAVRAGKRVAPRSAGVERLPFIYVGGTMLITGLMLTLFSLLPPSGAALSGDRIDPQSRLANYLIEAQALEQPDEVEFIESGDSPSEAAGEAHAGDEGAMGDETAAPADRRYAIEGAVSREDQQMARERARENAATAGILGTLQRMSGSFSSPTSPFGADMALGADAMSALGNMTGSQIGDSFGFGGLGLRGTGRGAGGNGLGTIGVGEWGGIGSSGTCTENCAHGPGGYGTVTGGLRTRAAHVPHMREGVSAIAGALSRETIRRVVQRHHNEVKFCYERALQNRPDLEGRVTARFMISPAGAVVAANVQSSSLGDASAEQCVTDAVRRFVFPTPENGGMVSVSYPFVFSTR